MNQHVIEILTEEPSMENFLREILPQILPPDYALDTNCFIRPHQGKSHLKKSIPIKMKAYTKYGYPVKVFIIHDQDSNDCIKLKNELNELCKTGINIPFVIRIVCRELENWYLGDLQAVEEVYPNSNASSFVGKSKYRIPDAVFGSDEMSKIADNFSKTHASREIPKFMRINENKSLSFKHFLSGINKLISYTS